MKLSLVKILPRLINFKYYVGVKILNEPEYLMLTLLELINYYGKCSKLLKYFMNKAFFIIFT